MKGSIIIIKWNGEFCMETEWMDVMVGWPLDCAGHQVGFGCIVSSKCMFLSWPVCSVVFLQGSRILFPITGSVYDTAPFSCQESRK